MNNFGMTICNELQKSCNKISFFPDSNLCKLLTSLDPFIANLATSLNIPESEALRHINNFFKDKSVTILPPGLQGTVYKTGLPIQTAVPAIFLHNAITATRTFGVTSISLASSQPLIIVAITSSRSSFFNVCAIFFVD